MPRLPRVTAGEVIRVIGRLVFKLARSSSSHFICRSADGTRVTVPCHAGAVLHPKVLKSIMADSGLSVEDLIVHLAE
jgi:predicted RNA binding protein YcfA (HicA-like mRNA interferase family)